MITDEELVSIVKGYVTDTIEPLLLQISAQKAIIEGLQDELKSQDVKLIELSDAFTELDGAIANIQIERLNKELDELKDTHGQFMAATVKDIQSINDAIQSNAVNVELQDKSMTAFKTELDVKILEEQEWQRNHIAEQIKAITDNLNDVANDIDNNLTDKIDHIKLTVSDITNKELLRLNDHVNSKLTTLKGEKGDPGEKGDQGDSGFLSGVSKWENGQIVKEKEAITHSNGIWLCKVDQTAFEPGVNDDYELIVDGINTLELNNGCIHVKFTSGKSLDLGRVTMIHKGVYNPDVKYNKFDIVTIDKTSFVSMIDDNTTRPPSGENWKLLSGRGAKGTKGDTGDIGIEMEDLAAMINDTIDRKLETI